MIKVTPKTSPTEGRAIGSRVDSAPLPRIVLPAITIRAR